MNYLSLIVKSNNYKIAIATVLIGSGSGLFSMLMHESVLYLSKIAGTTDIFGLRIWLGSILLASVSYLLTKYLFKDTNGSGIPQVKLSLIAYKGDMPKRMAIGKFITSLLTLSSGLSFGKEGPLVTISAAWGNLVSHCLKLNRQTTKLLVAAGATAGLAAAFNTPIAAVVFTIEEILGELNTKYLGPIIFTSVVASITSYKLLGNKSTFISLSYGFHIGWHLIFYLLLGLIMSFIGYFFVKMIISMKYIRSKYFEGYELIFIILSISILAMCSQVSNEILGDGSTMINRLLLGSESNLMSYIFIVFMMKIFLTSLSYSTGLSGGLFMPVLFLGALGGSLIATFLIKLGVSHIEIGAFAVLGMTSLLVSVIRTPFTAFVMLFEMTRDYELILPLMISSIASYWVSSFLNSESVYESVSEYEGVHLPTSRDNECLSEMSVEDCMVKNVLTLDYTLTLEEALTLIQGYKYGGYPIIKNNKIIGIANISELNQKFLLDPSLKIHELTHQSIISIYPDQSLLVALDRMKRFEIGRLPVVSRFSDKQLMGIITPKDIVNYLGLTKANS